jgi:hypothetical protein
MVVNSSTNINKTINHLTLLNTKKMIQRHMTLEIQALA